MSKATWGISYNNGNSRTYSTKASLDYWTFSNTNLIYFRPLALSYREWDHTKHTHNAQDERKKLFIDENRPMAGYMKS